MSVTLRPATLADLDAVTEVVLSSTRESYAGLMPEATIAAVTPELVTRLWTKTLTGIDSGSGLVAVSDTGTVLGVTRFQLAGDFRGVVHSLYVSPRAQRMGIGGMLLSAAATGLRDRGAAVLNLWVIASNTPSIAFYRTQGWTPDGETRTQPGFDVKELRLEFSGPLDNLTNGGGAASTRSQALTSAAREIVGLPDAPAGVAIGLRSHGRDWTGVAGSRGVGDDDAPMTLGTAHDLASITKVLATTTALIGLVSAGDVRLDDPIVGYLPGFTGGGKESVTVRQLLTHRGGLWEWQPLYLGGRSGAEAAQHAEELPLRYQPGTARHYSDLGFILLGRVVEVACGMDLAAATRRLVTEPLGLNATRFAAPAGFDPASPAATAVAASAPNDVTERRMIATGEPYPVLDTDSRFDSWRDHPIIGEVNDGNAFHAFGGVSGHAGLFSTLDDLLSWAAALADYREHDALWKPDVVQTFLTDGPDPEQALGFRRYQLTVDGTTTTMYGHPGFVGCVVGFSPEAGVALALCSNRLLKTDAPVPTDALWSLAREAASTQLTGSDPKARR